MSISPKKILLPLLGCILLVLADQGAKILATDALKGNAPFVLIPGVLQLQYLENRGAAFGMFQNNQGFFAVFACVALAVLCFYYLRIPREASGRGRSYLPLRLCFLFVAAGAAGNLIDRVALGYVRDFIYFVLIDFPIFNVADIYVTVSMFALILLIFLYYNEEELGFFSLKKG